MSRRTARAQIKAARARQQPAHRTVEPGNNNRDAYPQGELSNPASPRDGFETDPQRRK